MASITLYLKHENSSFCVVVRPSDWNSSFTKLQCKIENKTKGLSFPSRCYLSVRQPNQPNNVNDANEVTIHSLESLQTVLSGLNERKVYADICVGQIKGDKNHQCMIKYANQTTSFVWSKGDDFEIDQFFNGLRGAIKNEIDFGTLDVDINEIEDVLSSLNLYYCNSSNENKLIEKIDDLEDLMLDDLNDNGDIKDIWFVLTPVENLHFCCGFDRWCVCVFGNIKYKISNQKICLQGLLKKEP